MTAEPHDLSRAIRRALALAALVALASPLAQAQQASAVQADATAVAPDAEQLDAVVVTGRSGTTSAARPKPVTRSPASMKTVCACRPRPR